MLANCSELSLNSEYGSQWDSLTLLANDAHQVETWIENDRVLPKELANLRRCHPTVFPGISKNSSSTLPPQILSATKFQDFSFWSVVARTTKRGTKEALENNAHVGGLRAKPLDQARKNGNIQADHRDTTWRPSLEGQCKPSKDRSACHIRSKAGISPIDLSI